MPLLTDDDHITVQPFASVQALLHLSAIEREPASVSQASSRHLSQSEAIPAGVDLAEGCILTKTYGVEILALLRRSSWTIHPEHFLPDAVLSIYDRTTKTVKSYVPSHDGRLRESVDPTSTPLPAFRHIFQRRPTNYKKVNIFLVALNAEIKFRRYFNLIEHRPLQNPLPTDVISLMRRVIELVDLLYWRPSPKVGSRGAFITVTHNAAARKNPERIGKSSLPHYIDKSPGEESRMEIEDQTIPSKARRKRHRLPDADPQTRKTYGSALMTGHDLDYDPALFEYAFPLNEVPPLYSNNLNVERWNQGVVANH